MSRANGCDQVSSVETAYMQIADVSGRISVIPSRTVNAGMNDADIARILRRWVKFQQQPHWRLQHRKVQAVDRHRQAVPVFVDGFGMAAGQRIL